LIENVFTLTPALYPIPNTNPNPKAQLCFWTDEMASFFDQVYRYQLKTMKNKIDPSELNDD